MEPLTPSHSLELGVTRPGATAERHLRRAAELTADLIDLVAEVRTQLEARPEPAPPDQLTAHDEPHADERPEDPGPKGAARQGLAPGEMRNAFAAASRSPRRHPRELAAVPPPSTDDGERR